MNIITKRVNESNLNQVIKLKLQFEFNSFKLNIDSFPNQLDLNPLIISSILATKSCTNKL